MTNQKKKEKKISQDQNATLSRQLCLEKNKHPQTTLQNHFKNPVYIYLYLYIYIFQYNYSAPRYTVYCIYTPLGYLK